jgi:hypothetical protein
MISLWTVGGRKRLAFSVPDYFLGYFLNALSFDSLTVKERNGQLIGYLRATLQKHAVKGSISVGVDRLKTWLGRLASNQGPRDPKSRVLPTAPRPSLFADAQL